MRDDLYHNPRYIYGVKYDHSSRGYRIIENTLRWNVKDKWHVSYYHPEIMISENGHLRVIGNLLKKNPQIYTKFGQAYFIYEEEEHGEKVLKWFLLRDLFFKTYCKIDPTHSDHPYAKMRQGSKFMSKHNIIGTHVPYRLPDDYNGPLPTGHVEYKKQYISQLDCMQKVKKKSNTIGYAKILLDEKRSGKRLRWDHPTRWLEHFPKRRLDTTRGVNGNTWNN